MGSGERNELDSLIAEIKPFMTTCIIEYSLICSAVMYILWRNIGHVPAHRRRQRKQRFHVDCSSSTKGLFLGLLFMVFTIVAMIIFFTKIRSEQNYAALWIFYAWDAILHVVSTLALVVGILRIRRLHYVPRQRRAVLLDDILLIVGLLGQLMYCIFSVVPLNNGSLTASMIVVTSLLRMIEVLLQTVFIIFGQRLAALSAQLQERNPGRETITFLLLTNLSMFITNTFETQKAAANPLTSEFYGESIWTVIVHSTVPLSIFYRFHSTVCLAEIWKEAYRMKASESPLLPWCSVSRNGCEDCSYCMYGTVLYCYCMLLSGYILYCMYSSVPSGAYCTVPSGVYCGFVLFCAVSVLCCHTVRAELQPKPNHILPTP